MAAGGWRFAAHLLPVGDNLGDRQRPTYVYLVETMTVSESAMAMATPSSPHRSPVNAKPAIRLDASCCVRGRSHRQCANKPDSGQTCNDE